MPNPKPRRPEADAEELNLHNAGLKATLPRLKVLEVFRTSKTRHLSADDVFRHLMEHDGDVGLATVYRVLSQLEQAGLIERSAFGEDRAVYELNEGSHHDHLVCIKCGQVDEFTDTTIEARQQAVAKQHGYLLTDHRLALYGLCPKCGAAKAKVR
ncbi:MAG: ferric iron uptake transcriptional regulator [Rubrivivax sp.]